jgi:hypothetical protein
MEIVLAEWRARTLAEYRSAAVGAELMTWLIRLGFSSDTLQAAHVFVGNELDHADMSWEAYNAVGGSDEDILEVPEGSLVLAQGFGGPTFDRLVLACLDRFCVAETLAAPLFEAMLEEATESAPKQVLQRIVADLEAQTALGWMVLDEALEQDEARVDKLAKKSLPAFFGRRERTWGVLPDDWIEGVGPHEQAYGLVPRARYKREFYQAIAEEVLPRLEKRNLPARTAWGRRKK